MPERTPEATEISIDARARDMLAQLVSAGGKARYVRIHVGRG
jgi:hypothetical protein